MKILFIGDISGSVGRQIVEQQIPLLKEKYEIDLIVANGENAAHGKGITKKTYNQLIRSGIDVITMGNHTYDRDDIFTFINEVDNLVVPANLDPEGHGISTLVVNVKNKRIAISNLCGEVLIKDVFDSPFHMMEDILEEYNYVDFHIVDLHAETTSEKIAFAYAFEGRIAAVVGTHTHVQTADERVSNGTAAISDLGMCGAYRSVLGRDVDEIVSRFTSDKKVSFTMASGEGIFCGCIVEIDEANNKAINIERIQIRPY